MAFIPDELINQLHELSPKAALLFVHYCKWRNGDTGHAFPSLSTIAKEMEIPKTSACELRKQLIDRGWIKLVDGNTVKVVGCFESFGKVERHSEKSNDDDVSESRTEFDKPEQDSEKSNGVRKSRTDTVRKSRIAYKEQPAHGEKEERSRSQSSRSRRSDCDEDFFAELQAKPAYQGLDVKRVYDKMVVWCEQKRKQPTRLRLINWLNREEVPLQPTHNGNGRHNGIAASPKSQFCGKCDHGYLPPLPGQSEARRCSCVRGREASV